MSQSQDEPTPLFGADWRRSLVQELAKDTIKATVLGSGALLVANATELIDASQSLVIACVTTLVAVATTALLVVAAVKSDGALNAFFAWVLLFVLFGPGIGLPLLQGSIRSSIWGPLFAGWIAFVGVVTMALVGLIIHASIQARAKRLGDRRKG